MAFLFQKRDIYYISLNYKGKRIRKSLGTSNRRLAKKLANQLEENLLQKLIVGKPQTKYSSSDISELIELFMDHEHNWRPRTREVYETCFKHFLSKGLPETQTYKAMVIRCLNRLQNWAFQEGFIERPRLIPGGNNYIHRMRVFNVGELDALLKLSTPIMYRDFVRFAYYTGARQGEIRSLSYSNIFDDHLEVFGKSGKRIIKLNKQAQLIINRQQELWNYSRSYVNHRFKKNVRRLGIKDARFHDLRRTFGYNLISKGIAIYQVSKLLGHKSVTTTEKHYAPIMVKDIPDFEL